MLRHSSQEVGAPRQESPISTHARTARCTTALSQHSPPSPPQPTPSPSSPCRRRHCCRCPRPCRLRTRPRHRRTCSPRPSARTRPRHRRTCSPRPSAHDGRRCTRTRSHTRARTCTQPAFSACASDAPRLACVRYRVKNLPRRVLKTGVCALKPVVKPSNWSIRGRSRGASVVHPLSVGIRGVRQPERIGYKYVRVTRSLHYLHPCPPLALLVAEVRSVWNQGI